MTENKKRYLYSFIEMAIVVALTVVVFKYVVIPVRINGISMENTLHNDNIALINAIGVKPSQIERFDVVVIYSDFLNEKIIKRVIGLPGETIEFKNDILYINGVKTEQDFLDSAFVTDSKIKYNTKQFTDDFKVTIKDDEYFVMGDNRLRSTDSRELGTFTIDNILGMDGLVVYPFSDIQWLG